MGYLPEKDIGSYRKKKGPKSQNKPSRADYFRGSLYNKSRWKRFSAIYRKEYPFCVKCGKLADDVDHIQPLVDGGDPYDYDNLQSLCKKCHGKKTKKEMRKRKK